MWTINGAYPRINGRYVQPRTEPVLRFRVRGTTFPDNAIAHDDVDYRSSNMAFVSAAANTIHIDYGDGNSDSFPFVLSGGLYRFRMRHLGVQGTPAAYDYPAHYYIDQSTDDHGALPEHTVSVRFEKPDLVTEMSSDSWPLYGDFPSDFGRLSGLQKIQLYGTYNLTGFPIQLGQSVSLKELILTAIGPAISVAIPPAFLNIDSLQYLGVSASINLSDPDSSNLNQINKLKNSLTGLGIASCGVTILPEELGECTLLNRLVVHTNPALPAEAPTWFASLVNLKELVIYRTFRTQARCDAFVNSFYNLIIGNAPISGTSSDPFRSMTVDYVHPTNPGLDYRPSGVYQQPAGYVQGSSNGTPASPAEKVWVMDNQYDHTWNIKAI